MALDFPSSPITGQTYVNGNLTWKWNGTAWNPVGGQTVTTQVISTPVFSTPSQASVGQSVVVKATATSLLSGGSISAFRITVPGFGTNTVTATAGAGQYSFTTSGSLGTAITVQAQAVDSYGNLSPVSSYDILLSSNFVNKAVISSPANLSTNVTNGLVITTAAFTYTGGLDTLDHTEFEIRDGANALIWSGSATAGLSITVPDGTLTDGATVFLRARHVGVSYGAGQWSDATQITMEPILTPTNYGDAFQGGFYAGRIIMSGSIYAIIVGPASSETVLASATSTTGTLTTGAKSIFDGLANTNDLILNSTTFWPAASYCYNLSLNGYTDWYLPSLMELELAYRTLKPNETANNLTKAVDPGVGSGTITQNTTTTPWTGNVNDEWGYASATMSSIPAGGVDYTNSASVAAIPAMTTASKFQSSMLQEAFASDTYYCSSGPSGTSIVSARENLAWFRFTDGYAECAGGAAGAASYTTTTRRVRPFRRVFIRAA